MASYNKMTIIGNLGGDPEMRYTPTGAPVTSFNVAVTERRRQADGNQQETTQWFRVSCWNKLAEIASQYLKKGMQVYVEGPLLVREFTGNDGQKRFSLDLTAREFQMLGARNAPMGEDGSESMEQAGPGASRQEAPVFAGNRGRATAPAAAPAGHDESMDDIPF